MDDSWKSRCKSKTFHLLYKKGRKYRGEGKMSKDCTNHTSGRRSALPKLLSKMKGVRVRRRSSEDTVTLMDDTAPRNCDRVHMKQDPKPKKRGWKKFRRVASVTCRYIGLGIASMYPIVPEYPPTDYYFGDPSSYRAGYFNSNDPQWLAGLAFTRW